MNQNAREIRLDQIERRFSKLRAKANAIRIRSGELAEEYAALASGCEPGTVIKMKRGGASEPGQLFWVAKVTPAKWGDLGFDLEAYKFKKDGAPGFAPAGVSLNSRTAYSIVDKIEPPARPSQKGS